MDAFNIMGSGWKNATAYGRGLCSFCNFHYLSRAYNNLRRFTQIYMARTLN